MIDPTSIPTSSEVQLGGSSKCKSKPNLMPKMKEAAAVPGSHSSKKIHRNGRKENEAWADHLRQSFISVRGSKYDQERSLL